MKTAIAWFKQFGFTFDDKVTVRDIIDIQEDARFDLTTALAEANDSIKRSAWSAKVADNEKKHAQVLQTELTTLKQELASLTAQRDEVVWFEARLKPTVMGTKIAYHPNWGRTACIIWDGINWTNTHAFPLVTGPTHWAELPTPPQPQL